MSIYNGRATSHPNAAVTVDGKKLPLRLELRRHSPDGFAWGYEGSGPAQLALAMLAHHFEATPADIALIPNEVRERHEDKKPTRSTSDERRRAAAAAAQALYQDFKRDVIARWDRTADWQFKSQDITRWIESRLPPLVAVAQQAVAAMDDGPGDEGDLRRPSSDPDPDYEDTQLALACELLGRIGIPSPDLLRRLDELLDYAQNPPPEGKADGSIHERKFNRLRAMVRAGETFLAAYNTALED